MRRSPSPGLTATPQNHTPNFYSDNDNSSVSTASGDSTGHRSTGPGLGEPEGRRSRGSSCGEPALSAGVPEGTTWPGSSRQKPSPGSYHGPTARSAATVRGGASGAGGVEPGVNHCQLNGPSQSLRPGVLVEPWDRHMRAKVCERPGNLRAPAEPSGSPVVSEEQLDLLLTLDQRPEIPTPRVSKSFLSHLFQILSVWLSPVGDVLVCVFREVCSIRFLLTAVSLLSLFLAVLWWGLLHLVPPLEHEAQEVLTISEYRERVRSQAQQLQQLQAELEKLRKEVSSIRATNSERVAKLVFQRLNEDFVQKADFALSSVGASIDLEKTSHDYKDPDTPYFWNRFSFWNYARPPTVILQPDVFPGNCWAFEGDQGQVVIRMPGLVQLSDITLQHPPPSVVVQVGGASSAPRDFAVYGLQVDDETEVFLGKFTFDVEKSEIQTFHLQNDPPAAFPKVKIQILSNWGHPRFTCLYRVRAHGKRTSKGAGESTTEVAH